MIRRLARRVRAGIDTLALLVLLLMGAPRVIGLLISPSRYESYAGGRDA